MYKFEDTLALAKVLASKSNPQQGLFDVNGVKISRESLEKDFNARMHEIASTPKQLRKNKDLFLELIEQSVDTILPVDVMDRFGQFADVQTVPVGNKVYFKRKVGQIRAKQFVTRVAEAGRYKTFKLADETMEIKTAAYGSAARLEYEKFLMGQEQWSDYMPIITQGFSDKVFQEIAKGYKTLQDSLPADSRFTASSNQFQENALDQLLATVSAFGSSPVIYCTPAFAMTMLPNAGWVSDTMRDQVWRDGYFTRYKGGIPIVVIPNSFKDEKGIEWQIDNSTAYIMPSGGMKPVQIVFEGQTEAKEFQNRDWSVEIQTYMRFGVGIINFGNIGFYQVTSLAGNNPVPPRV